MAAVTFFTFVQNVYTFFSSSTHRWAVLLQHLSAASEQITVKRLSSTRWSARADATRALKKGYKFIKEALAELHSCESQPPATRHEAGVLSSQLTSFETAILLVVWNNIGET